MSTIDLPLPTSEERPPRDAAVKQPPDASLRRNAFALSVETLLYLAIGLLSVFLHLWALGERALHHDETLHAVYSWYLYVGRGYIHDPLLHGPFLYHFGALMYLLFGDNDATARLGVAIFGIVLTLTPYLLRRELGRLGALLASCYLLLSPSVLYMGRFVRHDMYSLLFEMLFVVGLIRYLRSRRAGWLYLCAAAFGFMVTNQETSYLFAVIMGGAIIIPLLWRVWKPGVPLLGIAAVLVAALVFVLPGEAKVDGERNATRDPNGQLVVEHPGPLFGWGPLETADNGYALRIRNRADDDGGRGLIQNLGIYLGELWTFFRHPGVLLSIGVLLAAVGALFWSIWRRRGSDGTTAWQHAREQHPDAVLDTFASLADRRRVLIALGIFALIYTLFFTAFFTNLLGVITGTTGSVLYWLAQHDVRRGNQPGQYYFVLLAVYEPLIIIWSIVAAGMIGWMWWRGRQRASDNVLEDKQPADENGEALAPATRQSLIVNRQPIESLTVPLLLLWWSIATVAIYSWAGEKMPWLVIHLVLPLTLLAAWGCDRAVRACLGTPVDEYDDSIENFDPATPQTPSRRLVFSRYGQPIENPGPATLGIVVGTIGVISLLGFMLMSVAVRQSGENAVSVPLVVVVVVFLLVMLLGAALIARYGWRWSVGALAVGICAVLAVGTVRSSLRLSFLSGDIPREMMIYTQTSPDVARIMRRLERASMARYNNLSMPVIYDNETVWLWYFRNFTNAQVSGQVLSAPPEDDIEAVVMLQENIDAYPQNRENLSGFRVQRLPLRWWFPEDEVYRLSPNWRTQPLDQASLLARLLRAPFDSKTLADTWQFLIYRNPGSPLGSSDFVLAVRPDLADEIGLGTGADDK